MITKCSPETSVSTYNITRWQTSRTLQNEKFPAMKITWKIVSVFELTETLLTFSKACLKSGMIEHYRY